MGTVGTIFTATEKASGRVVALSGCILQSVATLSSPLDFKREMTILEKLRHPNIIAYYGGWH